MKIKKFEAKGKGKEMKRKKWIVMQISSSLKRTQSLAQNSYASVAMVASLKKKFLNLPRKGKNPLEKIF